ncbi:hypothetical protein Slin14017_G128490 [Septoria linicola]|nr:hypothetical protein Slin14017_G128490 [Septoria linicola]
MSSTIEAWIAHVADYTQLRPAVATAPAISCNIPGTLSTTQKRKRKRNDLDSANANLLTAPRKAPRSALAAMDPNVVVVMPRRLSPRKKSAVRGYSNTERGSSDDEECNEKNDEEPYEVEDAAAAVAGTPRARDRPLYHPHQNFPPPPVFAPPKSPTSSSRRRAPASTASYSSNAPPSSVQSSTRSSRAKSPVKNHSDLFFADHRVRFAPAINTQQLPPDIKALHFKLHAVKSSMNIIPHQMQDAIKSTDDDLPIYDHFFDSSCSREMSDLIQEFHELTNICQAASRAKALSISEASWNDEVHSRLFREAFRLYSGIRHENVTSARPCQDFLPKHSASGSIMESKLVDYTVHLESAPGSDFETRIARVLDTQPATCQTITQTLYHPVRLRPAAISIETKSGSGNDDDARTQMGIWVSAHFNRQRSLLYSRYGDDAHDIVLPAHLLVVFNVSVMSISYAVARGEEIQIVPGQDIGLPTSLESGYACLAALRHLAAWADGEYRKWVEKYLLG